MPINLIDRTGASALIPEEVSREILKAIPAQSAALSLMRRLPDMTTNQTRLPVLATLPQAYFVAGDTGLKNTSNVEWTNKFINAEEIAVIIPVPEAVLSDTSYDIWGEIKPSLVEAFGAVIDAAVLFGTGAPSTWPAGLVPGAIVASNVVASGTGADISVDVSEVMSAVEADGYDVTGFASYSALRGALRSLRTTDGTPIYQPSLATATPNLLYNIPIFPVKNGSWDSTKARLLAGDWTKAVYSIRQDITFKIATEAMLSDGAGNSINLFQQDAIALRAVMRLGWQVANPVNRESPDETTRYPFGVLTPAAVTNP